MRKIGENLKKKINLGEFLSILCQGLLLGSVNDEPHSSSWSRLPDPPLACCGAAIFRGCLLAIGGKDESGVLRRLHMADLPNARQHVLHCPLLSRDDGHWRV